MDAKLKGKGVSGALLAIELWNDLCTMADEIGHRPGVKLSHGPRAIEQRHNELVELYNQLAIASNPEDPILVSDEDPRIGLEQKFREWTGETTLELKLLRTRQELLEEGRVMHHCVGSYANHVANGDTAIFSITTEKGNRATVEFRWRDDYWKIFQIQGPYNKPVDELSNLRRAIFDVERGFTIRLPEPKRLARPVMICPMPLNDTFHRIRNNGQQAFLGVDFGVQDDDFPF